MFHQGTATSQDPGCIAPSCVPLWPLEPNSNFSFPWIPNRDQAQPCSLRLVAVYVYCASVLWLCGDWVGLLLFCSGCFPHCAERRHWYHPVFWAPVPLDMTTTISPFTHLHGALLYGRGSCLRWNYGLPRHPQTSFSSGSALVQADHIF